MTIPSDVILELIGIAVVALVLQWLFLFGVIRAAIRSAIAVERFKHEQRERGETPSRWAGL